MFTPNFSKSTEIEIANGSVAVSREELNGIKKKLQVLKKNDKETIRLLIIELETWMNRSDITMEEKKLGFFSFVEKTTQLLKLGKIVFDNYDDFQALMGLLN